MGLNKIAIVGPESSGKSSLSEALAKKYHTTFVKEYAREYLINLADNYREEDLLQIAMGQIEAEKKEKKKADKFLFCDTNLLVIIIWSKYKYGKVNPLIIEKYKPDDYALHLLLKPDLEYADDPLRENPSFEERTEIFKMYKEKLIALNVKFEIIAGQNESRLYNAVKALDSHF